MLLVLSFISGTVYFTLFSDFFNVKVIEINGTVATSPQKIEKVANIAFGENLFLQNNLAKEKALKKAFTIIDEVKIKQKLPDTIIIEVVEKETKLIALMPSGYILVDGNGEVLDINDKLNQAVAPLLTGIEFPEKTQIGQLLVESGLREALAFLKNIPDDSLHLIKEITVGDNGIAIFPTGSYMVLIGENDDVPRKLNTLELLMRDSTLLGNTVDYIDISNPEKIIMKTKEDIS